MLRASLRALANFKMEEIMAHNSRAKHSEKELLTLTLASGVTIPDSKVAREVTELVRDTENSLLFKFKPRLLLCRCNRQTERSHLRAGAAVYECNVPRYG